MKNLVISLVLTIMVMGITFWAMNNPNGIGAGIDQGSVHLSDKISRALP